MVDPDERIRDVSCFFGSEFFADDSDNEFEPFTPPEYVNHFSVTPHRYTRFNIILFLLDLPLLKRAARRTPLHMEVLCCESGVCLQARASFKDFPVRGGGRAISKKGP